jgi:hypothetical protein
LKSVRSIAGETELFIDQIDDGRVSNTFAAVHFKYLRDQDRDVQEDLASASRPNEDLLIREAQAKTAQSPVKCYQSATKILTELGKEICATAYCTMPWGNQTHLLDGINDRSPREWYLNEAVELALFYLR